MTSRVPALSLVLPPWLEVALPPEDRRFGPPEERMDLVLALAGENVRRRTGGPFAAAVFEADTGRLLAAGINRVVPGRGSLWHAEMVALALAQARAGTHDLGAPGQPRSELVTSAEPCAMCLGAIPWSGVSGLVCGARDEDARQIGFDEGDKPVNWPDRLAARGIALRRDVRREEAAAILREYARGGGPIYNPHRD